MDFNLTEQEKMLQQAAKDFADKSVRPRAAEIDRSNRFPADLAQELGKLGYRGLAFPTGYGGTGAGYLSHVLALEQICRASVTVGAIMAISIVPGEAVLRFGNEEQKERLLPPIAEGKILGILAFTEAETGSDPRAIATTARQTAGGYVISGQKQFISYAVAADRALLFAKEEGKGIDAFLVDLSSRGVHVSEPYDTLGLRGLGTATIDLDEVFVPQEDLLYEPGRGFDVLLEVISLGRLGAAVEALALSEEALDLSLKFARERKAQGKPIARLPTIQWHIAEMASRIEAMRWLVYRTAFVHDQGKSIRHESSVAKLFTTQTAVEITRMAMQVHGSYGTTSAMSIERLYRDAKMLEIYVGVSEIQRSIIAGNLI
ncbi:MAG: acyl-CoA dehydrogenase family protein [Chloroflexi bacterium]|nr:acyl-CoA dehydrogenase family protein [Chloroflexota bacterium]